MLKNMLSIIKSSIKVHLSDGGEEEVKGRELSGRSTSHSVGISSISSAKVCHTEILS